MVVANRQWRIGEGATAPQSPQKPFSQNTKFVEKLGGGGIHYMLEAETD
jgi:hypothetical protein